LVVNKYDLSKNNQNFVEYMDFRLSRVEEKYARAKVFQEEVKDPHLK
jgi:hypothetical protein